jgi:hypothetical protein
VLLQLLPRTRQGIIVHQQNGGRWLLGHVQPREAAITAIASLVLSAEKGFWNSIGRLKTGASVIRNKEQDRKLGQFTTFFACSALPLRNWLVFQ